MLISLCARSSVAVSGAVWPELCFAEGARDFTVSEHRPQRSNGVDDAAARPLAPMLASSSAAGGLSGALGDGVLELQDSFCPGAPDFDQFRRVVVGQQIEAIVAIDVLENGINFVSVITVNGPDAVIFHLDGGEVGDGDEDKQIKTRQAVTYGCCHRLNEGVGDIGGAVIGGVLGIGDVIGRCTIEDHVIAAGVVAINSAGVVQELDAVVEPGAGLPEFKGVPVTQGPVGLLLTDVVPVALDPVPHHRAFAQAVGA